MRKFDQTKAREAESTFNSIKGLDLNTISTASSPSDRPAPTRAPAARNTERPAPKPEHRSAERPEQRADHRPRQQRDGGNRSYNSNRGSGGYNRNGPNRDNREYTPRAEPKIDWTVDNSYEQAAWFKRQAETRPRPGEGVESLLKRFKSKCEKSGILKELRRREFFKTEGQVAREDKLKAEKRAHKERQKRAYRERND